jgi:hypothetical protein
MNLSGNDQITKITMVSFIPAGLVALIGVALTVIQTFGEIQLDAWGLKLTTKHVGIGALALSAVMVVRVTSNAFDALSKK